MSENSNEELQSVHDYEVPLAGNELSLKPFAVQGNPGLLPISFHLPAKELGFAAS